MRRFLTGLATLAATASAALAGTDITITPILVEGDDVPGIGQITTINSLAINNLGQWVIEADTNHADTDQDLVFLSGVGLGPFTVIAREGQPLASPPGATLGSAGAVTINDSGNMGWNLFLDGTSGTSDDSGVYFNLDLVFQEGSLSTGLDPNTPFRGFFSCKINNANQILVPATVDIPNIGTTVDRALIRIENPGGAYTETIIVKENDEIVPGRFVTEIENSAHEVALNDHGDVMYAVDVDGATTDDILIFINNTLIAREGDPSPIPGRNYASLASPELDLNNNGDYVFSGSLDGDSASNVIIIKNGAKFMQEGDNIKAIPPGMTFTSFGSGPILIDDDGDVLWYGDWNDPDTTIDTGLFLNDQLLIQEGVTAIDIGDPNNPNPVIVEDVRGVTEGFHMSSSGEYIIAELNLVGSLDTAVLIHVTDSATCTADLDGNGAVDVSDLGTLLANFGIPSGATFEQGDVNGDGAVNVSDLGALLGEFGAVCN